MLNLNNNLNDKLDKEQLALIYNKKSIIKKLLFKKTYLDGYSGIKLVVLSDNLFKILLPSKKKQFNDYSQLAQLFNAVIHRKAHYSNLSTEINRVSSNLSLTLT